MLIEKIKADQLTARKTSDKLAAALLTTLIGDAEMVGKNAGRAVTDDEVVAVIKKFIKGMDESIGYLQKYDNPEALATVTREKEILTTFLPQQLSQQQLEMAISALAITVGKNTGAIMKELKAKYAGKYDGKMASDIVKMVVAQ